jgi:cytochrome c-type biogenesis protein
MTADGLSLGTLFAAFAAGLVSVLSPCVVPLLPAYLSLVSGVSVEELQESDDRSELRARIRHGSLGFVAGFSAVFIALGASATAIGSFLVGFRISLFGLEFGAVEIAGVVIIVMGLHLLGVLRIPWLYRDTRYHVQGTPRGFLGTALVGAAFAFGWSPCVGPILGGILTIASSQETVYRGMALLAVYAAGLAIPFLLAGFSVEWFFRSLASVKRHVRRIEQVSGVLLVVLGVLVASNRLTALNAYFGFLNAVVEGVEGWLL